MQGCKQSLLFCLGLCLGILPIAGCVMFDKDIAKKAPVGPVHHVETVWNKEVMMVNQGVVGNANLPGMSGRVYLFGADFKHPVAAQGKARLLVEMNYLRPDGKPQTARWEFAKHELDQLLRRDYLGWGYTLPLPWCEFHPNIKHVNVRVSFFPEKGTPIMGTAVEFALSNGGLKGTSKTYVPAVGDPRLTTTAQAGQSVSPAR